jgi:hypothetical protein
VPSTSTVPEVSTMPSVENDTPGGVEDQSRSSTHNHKPFPRTNIKKR